MYLDNPYPQIQVVRVNGEEGAKAFRLPPNSSILLLDETAPIVWLKMTDGAGYPTLSPYSIAPIKREKAPTPEQTNDRFSKLEEKLERLEKLLYEKSDNGHDVQRSRKNHGANTSRYTNAKNPNRNSKKFKQSNGSASINSTSESKD